MSTALFGQLQVFLTVARLSGFSSAARELGVSRSAVSLAVRQLEEALKITLFSRTTRSVALTDAGKRLVESAGPGMAQVHAALATVAARPGEVVGTLRLSVPQAAVPFVIAPFLPQFRATHPRIHVELVIEDQMVDIVAGGFDAGVRLSEIIERDMVRVRLTPPFRFVVVGTPDYFAKNGIPRRPEDLLQHDCITFRSPTTGASYAWELERGQKAWRLPVRGGVITNDGLMSCEMAKLGLGLAYAPEPAVKDDIEQGRLQRVLDAFAPEVPGYFLYYPSRAQSSAPLRLFVTLAKKALASQPSA